MRGQPAPMVHYNLKLACGPSRMRGITATAMIMSCLNFAALLPLAPAASTPATDRSTASGASSGSAHSLAQPHVVMLVADDLGCALATRVVTDLYDDY